MRWRGSCWHTGRPHTPRRGGRQLNFCTGEINELLNLLIPCAETTLQAARDDQHRAAGGRAREFQFEATVWVRSYGGRQKWVRSKVIACSGPASYEVDVDDAVCSVVAACGPTAGGEQ